MKLYLQNIIDDISFENLPAKWQGFDFSRFSKDKTLFSFQQDALKNALKGLWLYFVDKKQDKQDLFHLYHQNGLTENLDYNLNRERKSAKYLLEYPDDYPVIENKISFAHFINRMSFWMATGSGKTLIIVKLIELLGKLIAEKELPARDILFLAHRDDLLDQFKAHVEEFNSFNFDTKINLKNLRDYESVKRENALPFAKNEITVFYYRSDLISDERKEKIVNFQNYDNGGRWYILLDEAHKGDKEDSKRQILYSILSRNGFLFNFSATFTDLRDFVTCAFRYNLADFVQDGYAKHIYVSEQDVTAFRRETDFSKQEKQKIVLKTLLLLTYINKNFEKIKRIHRSFYHRPLLLTLVNSVNKPDADLQLFFAELEKIAKEEPNQRIFSQAIDDLVKEFSAEPVLKFEENERIVLDIGELKKISYRDILQYVFNSKNPGAIEISFRPSDKSQVAFKLTTSERLFALIKTGQMPEWLKDELGRFNINHRFENEGFFETLNRDDSDINILMGSRAFYEGWDSNRPNIILFVNIGVGGDAKKFVLQSVGRGVRIEPLKNKRRQLQKLLVTKEVDEITFDKLKDLILPIESVFVFGTNANNLKEIIEALKKSETKKRLGQFFEINPEAEKRELLVPVYKDSEKIIAEEIKPPRYPISLEDFELTAQFHQYLGDKVALVRYDCDIKALRKVGASFSDQEKNNFYDFSIQTSVLEPDLVLKRVLNYFGSKYQEFENFERVEKGKFLVHFENIYYIDGERYDEIASIINKIKNYPKKQEEIEQLRLDFEHHGDLEKYDRQKEEIEKKYPRESDFSIQNQRIKVKYLVNHYYLPMVLSEQEKVDYLNHIINVDSEIKFVEDLEQNIEKLNSIFDWWMFSKLDQTLDEVYIPYFNFKEQKHAKFKPDFIFWAQQGKRYLILFIDPKAPTYTDANYKIDGYKRIFESNGKPKEFMEKIDKKETEVIVKLLMWGKGGTGEEYKHYWGNSFDDLAKVLREALQGK